MLIIAVTLIVGVFCQNGFIKGPDGYKYIVPEEKMDLPEPKSVDNDYLPPVEARVDVESAVNDIGVGDFTPYIRLNSEVDSDATTVEPEA